MEFEEVTKAMRNFPNLFSRRYLDVIDLKREFVEDGSERRGKKCGANSFFFGERESTVNGF